MEGSLRRDPVVLRMTDSEKAGCGKSDNRGFHSFFGFLSRRSPAQGLCKSYRKFLSRPSFCLSGIPGFVFRDGLVIGSSGLFSIPVDSPRDKRGNAWSGNRGLRFGIGADNGRLLSSN